MKRAIFVLLAFAALLPFPASAQVATGTPPFGSFGGGPDIINLANLNSHTVIPVRHKAGRGLSFVYDLSYDNSVWNKVTSGSTASWQPVTNWGWRGSLESSFGYVQRTTTLSIPCISNHFPFSQTGTNTSYLWKYNDAGGVSHFFGGTQEIVGTCTGQSTTTLNATANDGSGYTINVTGSILNSLFNAYGQSINVPVNSPGPGSATLTDRNGNQISVNSTGVFTDTLGTTVLTVAGGAPNPMTLAYTAPSGATASFTISYVTKTVKTNFGCSGISDYGPTNVSLVDRVTLPDNSFYQFTYEPTPGGTAGQVTGRLASVTLPTGGTISYSYSGGGSGVNGITCADGSAATLTRTTPDGTWTYTQVKNTGAASTTTITAPQLPYDSAANQTVIQFQGIYETQRKIYQGSSSGTLLETMTTCYNGNLTNCNTTAVSLPIVRRTATIQLGSLLCKHDYFWSSFGMPTETDDYDYASGAPGPLLRQTLIAYANLGNNLNAFAQTVTVKDGGGSIKSRQDTGYDQYSSFTGPNCILGAPQHDDAGHGCAFTARGNATSVTAYTNPSGPSGAITKNITYDSLGNTRTAQLNCCQLKQWNYSSPTKFAYPDSVVSGSSAPQLTTSATYDLNLGLVLMTTDENNKQTSFSYDSLLRLTDVARSDSAHITYSYPDVHTVTVTSPVQGTNTVKQTATLDGLGRPIKVTTADASGTSYSISETQYDTLGRPYKQSNPHNSAPQWTISQYDAAGRVTANQLPDSSQTIYSYTDASTTVTDPTGKQREFKYDALGRLLTVFEPDVASGNALTQQTSYAYNVLDQLTTVTQGSQTRTYNYDPLGRLTSTVTPEAGTTSFQYNSFDLLTQRTDARGVITTYGYDTLNRLSGVSYNVGTTGVASTSPLSFTYGTDPTQNNNGRLLTLTDGVGSETYAYDLLGRANQIQKVINSTTDTTSFAYNLAGETTSITYPSGRVVQQSYDAVGRLCAVGASGSTCSAGTTYATGFNYNPAFQVTGLNYGNGITAAYGFSPDRLQLTSLSYTKGASTLFSLNYSYGAAGSNNGQIAGITDSVDNGRSATYTYDALYRLTSTVTTGSTNFPKWGLSEVYDRYGNRSAQTVTAGTGVPSNSVTMDPVHNRVTGSPYAYDASGNMTNDGASTLTYDAENRMITSTGSGSGTYTYDGHGLRVKKVSGSTTTVYIFSGSKVIAEYENGAAVASPTREYIYSGGTLLAKIEAGATKYFHQDHLSNRVVTDSSGNTVAQLGHYPFGESWYNASGDKLLFTTYQRDSESGNDFAMARFNINRLGRFSSPDPLNGNIVDPQSLNRYAYVLNDPCNLGDPLGLNCTLKFGLNGQKLTAEAIERIKDIFTAAGVSVNFVSSGPADFQIQQNVPLVSAQEGATVFGDSSTGTARINNDAIIFRATNINGRTVEGYGIAFTAVGTVISHELGHLIIPCHHGAPPDCGLAGLMSPGPELGDAQFLDPKIGVASDFNFTDTQAQAIRDRCNKLHPPKKKASSAGGGGGGGGGSSRGGASGGGGCAFYAWIWDYHGDYPRTGHWEGYFCN